MNLFKYFETEKSKEEISSENINKSNACKFYLILRKTNFKKLFYWKINWKRKFWKNLRRIQSRIQSK